MVERMLVSHFFRRFFDNDTISMDGDTQTSVVRSLSIFAVPGLVVAFFLQTSYAVWPPRPLWIAMTDQYFFVLYSFVAMGAVAIFEWAMLFPDRLDFLILSPLPLKPRQMLAAKAKALARFLGLFLVGCNFFGMLMLPAVSGKYFFRHVYAHSVAVLGAGLFAVLFFLALGGILLCVLKAAWFRVALPMLQLVSVMALALLLLLLPLFDASLQPLLEDPSSFARYLPPFWFLGVYEKLLLGGAAPTFASPMSRDGGWGILIAAAVVLMTYPVAWSRMCRMAVEGSAGKRRKPAGWLSSLLHWAVIRRPRERAVFHFISQTMARNNRYQIYLAIYCGTGFALAIACALSFRTVAGTIHFALSDEGLHAMMPLLLFWVVAGLRAAFAFPMNLPAGWIFHMAGENRDACTTAAKSWVLLSAAMVMGCIVVLLRMAGWDIRQLMVQAECGFCLAILLVDGFFFSFRQSAPFNRPRLPGRTSLPVMLTLYVGVFPPFIFLMMNAEVWLERHPANLSLVVFVAVVLHFVLEMVRPGSEGIEEDVGEDGELFQTLGLSCGSPN